MCSGSFYLHPSISPPAIASRSAIERADALIEAAKIKDTAAAFVLLGLIYPAELEDSEVVTTKVREAERLFGLPPEDRISVLFRRIFSGES